MTSVCVRQAKWKKRVQEEAARAEQKHREAIALPPDPNAPVESTHVKSSSDEATPRPE
jgi:hypothetical protein